MLPPDLDHLWIQRLTCAGAVAQRRQLMTCEVLLHQHPVLGRRRAEARDAIALEQVELLLRLEAPVVHERRDPLYPRTEKNPLRTLGPAGIRGRPMAIAGFQAEPDRAGELMRPGIGVTVQN